MATRVDRPGGGVPPGASMIGGDNRSEQRREQMLRELQNQQLARTRNDAAVIVDTILARANGQGGGLRIASIAPLPDKPAEPARVDGGRTDAAAGREPSSSAPPSAHSDVDLTRAIADFQRQNGLPVTGRIDADTARAARAQAAPTAEPARPAASPEVRDAGRRLSSANDAAIKQRVGTDRVPERGREVPSRSDAVADPARLLASLVAAGFSGSGKPTLAQALQSFQLRAGLPGTGALDRKTLDALVQRGVVRDADAHADPPSSTNAHPKEPVEQPPRAVRRALQDPREQRPSNAVADRDVHDASTRPQASTKDKTTSSDTAARATASSTSTAEQTRLDSARALHDATMRGVQEGKGDPTASAGHGQTAGTSTGLTGQGGTSGGAGAVAGSGALTVDGPSGEETAVANAHAGDDDFADPARGQANIGDDDTGVADGHYRVPTLAEQIAEALKAIARDDDGTGPVTYSWDVSLHRPGVYAAGQPAEVLWRLVVAEATAFDPVWRTAAEAIASRLLYVEPDSDPPSYDDILHALQLARYR